MIIFKSKYKAINYLVFGVLLIVIFATVYYTSGKHFLNNEDQPNYNSQTNNNVQFNKIDVSKKIKDIEGWIKDRSGDFDLQNLKEKKIPDGEFELRIWASLRYGKALNCFIIQGIDANRASSLLTVYADGNGDFKKTIQGKIIVEKKTLQEPKSGWKKVNDYLIEKGVQSPLPFAWDEIESPPVKDESTVSLEVKKGENYSLISYGNLTKSTDGKTVINICNYLSNEFGVEIGC